MNPFIKAAVQGGSAGLVIALFLSFTNARVKPSVAKGGSQTAIADLIQAKAFQVVDENGRVVASLGDNYRGAGHLTLFHEKDKDGLPPTTFDANEGVRIVNDKFRAEVSTEKASFYHPDRGESELGVGYLILRSNNGGLELVDHKSGTIRAVLGTTKLRTSTGEVRERPLSSLALFNGDNHLIWSTP